MLCSTTTPPGYERSPPASLFIRGFRARTRGSLYTCRKPYIMYAAPRFHFPCESLWWDRFHQVRCSDRGSGELESEPYEHAISSWEKSFESSRLSRVWRRKSDRGLRSGRDYLSGLWSRAFPESHEPWARVARVY